MEVLASGAHQAYRVNHGLRRRRTVVAAAVRAGPELDNFVMNLKSRLSCHAAVAGARLLGTVDNKRYSCPLVTAARPGARARHASCYDQSRCAGRQGRPATLHDRDMHLRARWADARRPGLGHFRGRRLYRAIWTNLKRPRRLSLASLDIRLPPCK